MTELDQAINALFPDILRSVQESVRIPSVLGEPRQGKPFGEEIDKALCHALETARSLGLRTGNLGGYVGYAEYGEGPETVAVLGHLDVVPAGSGWTRPPFDAVLEGDRLYGRGTVDDKGPIIGALWILHCLDRCGIVPGRRIRVLLGTDEESGRRDMPRYLAEEKAPYCGFTPDGAFPVVNAEKGQLRLSFSRQLPEGDAVQLVAFEGGTVINAVPGEASATLASGVFSPERLIAALRATARKNGCEARISGTGSLVSLMVKGRSAHGSTPELGVNALSLLAGLLVETFPEESWAPVLERTASLLLGDTEGRGLGIAAEDAPSGRLTCNAGLASLKNGHLSVSLDIRHPVTFDQEELLRAVEVRALEEGYAMLVLRKAPPLWIPEDAEPVGTLLRVYREQTGEDARPLSMGGGTYAKSLPRTVAFGPRFPGCPDLAHQPDEYLIFEEYLRLLRIMGAAMVALAS
jgi:succinyl-diaminopimelate desuccinylase